MNNFRRIFWLLLVLMLVWPLAATNTQAEVQKTISVSGIVSGPSGPVSGVWVGIGSPQDWQETTTNASGAYSVSIKTNGELWFQVRPELSTRLTQMNLWMNGVTSNLTQDFDVQDGNLFELRITAGGSVVTQELWRELQSLEHMLVDEWSYQLNWDGEEHSYWAVLPPDVYYVTVRNPPDGYFRTTQAFDLRSGDVSDNLVLNTSFAPAIPYEPPDVSKISVGAVDDLGEATVTGVAGAALPLAHVLLVNLNSSHQAHTISEADGSFNVDVYAPPGSALMVKHGPASHRWGRLDYGMEEGVNPYPGAIFHLPHTHSGDTHTVPFAAVGGIDPQIDGTFSHYYVGAAWAISGTVGPLFVEGEWERVLDDDYDGQTVDGLYLGGLNWTHPALGDLNDDGKLDLLVGESSGRLVLYLNEGTTTTPGWQFETHDYAGVRADWWAAPALADVTGDGALDLFVGSGSGQVLVYYNDGTATAAAWPDNPDVTLEVGGGAAPALADLNNDGKLDLVVGHEGGTLYHFKNTGTTSSPAWTKQTESLGGISETDTGLQPSFVDLDGDTDLDLLIGRNGDLVWYRNDGPASNPTWSRVTDGYMGFGGSSAVSPAVGDWHGDGDLDLVIGQHWHRGALSFYRNDGPPTWTEQDHAIHFDLAGDSAPALADWKDNDGVQDLIIGQAHGDVHQYINQGTAGNADWQPNGILLTLPWTDHPHPFPTFADIDNDGLVDLFVGEGSFQGPGAGGNIRYYSNTGSAATPTWTLVTTSYLGLDVGGWSTPVFVDIDDDNDLDLLVGQETGTLTFVENTGTASAPAWANGPVSNYAGLDVGEYSAPAFLDVDDDGDLDMVIGVENGSLAYVRNTGQADNPSWEMVTTAMPGFHFGGRATPYAADVDGDGDSDLVVGGKDGGLHLYLYTGPGTPPAQPNTYAPGDTIQIEGALRLYGLAISAGTDVGDIDVFGGLSLTMLFDEEGRAIPARNYFMSSMLTPGGQPIQGGRRPDVWSEDGYVDAMNLQHLGGHTIGGELISSGRIPENLPPGIYQPTIHFGFNGVPTNDDWLAANRAGYSLEPHMAGLPPIVVGDGAQVSVSSATEQAAPVGQAGPKLAWQLLMDDFVQGTRGAQAREDVGNFGLASQIVTQGSPYYTPPNDARTGEPITYRLEPFLPMISFAERRLPMPPLIPFDLPGGRLTVSIREPDGTTRNLGSEAFAQSFHRTKTTRGGDDLNSGTVQLDDVYSLMAASDRFRTTFDQYGKHVITMNGTIDDIWGNTYAGGGTYDLWLAEPLDIDVGVLPGTPLAVDDTLNPTIQFYPRVPAEVTLTFTLYPDSDPSRATTTTVSGTANRFGYFSPAVTRSTSPISPDEPGEYRVDLTARYTDGEGVLYMGAMTWGGVVMTPQVQAGLVAHGRRGLDSLTYIPYQWFVAGRDLTIPDGAISHTLNPYQNGDVLWSRTSEEENGGNSLVLGASVHDGTGGSIEPVIWARRDRMGAETSPPGSPQERFDNDEIPLFNSTLSGRPPQFYLGQIDETIPEELDQIAYSYRSSQRPGLRVREVVAEDNESGGYWRLDTLYDDQLGVGVLGDQPNDFKFQYVGAVYRDLVSGRNEYLGQGSGWVFIPEDDVLGNRAMPPFAGPGNGGWTTDGGPLMTLKGEGGTDVPVHIFILPTGTRPGAVLEVGEVFRFAGHIMPTLNSEVEFTLTAPDGGEHDGGGQANSIGYYYDPADDLVVDEPGLWMVEVRVWHDGQCSGGSTVSPFPSGDVLGSDDGRYWFYVVPKGSQRLDVSQPEPGFLSFDWEVKPVTIKGSLPAGLSDVTIDYTISMPGTILEHGQVGASSCAYVIEFDPVALHDEFPNLDLAGRDTHEAGLADTFAIGLLLRAKEGNQDVYYANTLTLQGEQVFSTRGSGDLCSSVYLPVILKGKQ